jgi:hypothetical protein
MFPKKIIFFFATLSVISAGLFYCFKKIFAPRTLVICADKYYNPTKIQEIAGHYTLNLLKKINKKTFFNRLRSALPLEGADMHLYAPGKVVLHLKAPQPFLNIHFLPAHTSGVLTHQSFFEKTDSFDSFFLTSLPLIFFEDSLYELGSPACEPYTFFKSIPAPFFQEYEITWYDKTTIVFKARNLPIMLLMYSKIPFNTMLTKKIDYCKNFLLQKPELPKKNVWWVIDLRFKNQGVIRSQKRERVL